MARKRDTIPRPDVFRQSLLAGVETCARRTRFALQAGEDQSLGWVGSTGDLGKVMHAVLAEMLRTMWRHGHTQMPTEEAMVICREVYAAGDIFLPTEDRHTLAGLVLGFCRREFNPVRIVALERPITLDLVCPDGEIRTLKGQPDLITSDPPYGLEITDWKSGMGKPKRPRVAPEDPNAPIVGKQYLSDRGHFQLDTYGLLALKGVLEDGSRLLPTATGATLREIPLRWPGEPDRIAEITMNDLEQVEHDLAMHMMMVDRAISEGPKSPLWKPRPGSHCAKQCPVARSCPIPREARGDGAISTQHQADVAAAQFAVAGAQEGQCRSQLKAWQEQDNPPGRVNEREEVRWGPEPDAWQAKGGGRSFKIWPAANGNGNGGT